MECGADRKLEERVAIAKDEDELASEGKWMTNEVRRRAVLETISLCTLFGDVIVQDRKILSRAIHDFFSDEILKPSPKRLQLVTRVDAFLVQAHLLQHILLDNVIPVVRSEVLVNLQLGRTFHFNVEEKHYYIEVSLCCFFLCYHGCEFTL